MSVQAYHHCVGFLIEFWDNIEIEVEHKQQQQQQQTLKPKKITYKMVKLSTDYNKLRPVANGKNMLLKY